MEVASFRSYVDILQYRSTQGEQFSLRSTVALMVFLVLVYLVFQRNRRASFVELRQAISSMPYVIFVLDRKAAE